MIEMYQIKHYDTVIDIAVSTYHEDLKNYLPQEIIDFVEKNKDRYGHWWNGPDSELMKRMV